MNDMSTQTESTCPICGGTGWRGVPGSKEREVIRCECRVRGRAERLLAAAKIPARYEHCELSTFKYDPEDPEDAKLANARLAAGRLAVGILKALIRDKGVPCLFCDYRELLKSIQHSYNASVQATEMESLRAVF